MYYLIDGYNFLFRIDGSKKSPLEERRESLIHVLNEKLTPFKGRVAIVFDSAEQMREFPQCAILSHLEVIYAPKGQTADTYIIELVEQRKSPRTITVVTSDSGLAHQCRHIGTEILSIDDFIAFVIKKNTKRSPVEPSYCESKKEIERLRKIFEDRL